MQTLARFPSGIQNHKSQGQGFRKTARFKQSSCFDQRMDKCNSKKWSEVGISTRLAHKFPIPKRQL